MKTPLHSPQKEITIIGGGLAGWTLFEHLVSAGHDPDTLTLLEKGVSGRGSSGVLQAMLHPFTGSTLAPKPGAMDAWRYSRQWLQIQQRRSGQNIYTEHPLWRVATDEKTQTQFARSFEKTQQSDPHYPIRPLDHTEPLQNILAGYLFSEAAHVDISKLLAYFQQRYAGHCQLYRTLQSLSPQDQYWRIQTNAGVWSTRHVVLAPGHELLDFFPDLPFRNKRGEVIVFRNKLQIKPCVSGGGRYLVPLDTTDPTTGLYSYAGGATFYRDEALWPVSQAWKDLCDRFHWFPDIENSEVMRVWSGVRASLHPDREALCGPVPQQPGLWLMSAFSTRGLLQIPRHARALASQLGAQLDTAHSSTQALYPLPEESLPERVLRLKSVKKAGKNVFLLSPRFRPRV